MAPGAHERKLCAMELATKPAYRPIWEVADTLRIDDEHAIRGLR